MPDKLDEFVAAERADETPDFQVSFTKFQSSVNNRPAANPGNTRTTTSSSISIRCLRITRHGGRSGIEAMRREAIERAIAAGHPVITGKVRLVQDREQHVGLLYLAPVFRNSTSPTTPQERLEALEGLVYAPIVLEKRCPT